MKPLSRFMLLAALCCVVPMVHGCGKSTDSQPGAAGEAVPAAPDAPGPEAGADRGSVDPGASQPEPRDAVPAEDETPQQAIALFEQLLRDGDYETLIRQRFGERDRFSAEELDKMVSHFETRLKDRFADTLERAQSLEPEMSSDGNEATYKDDKMRLKLTKDANGHWNFNL